MSESTKPKLNDSYSREEISQMFGGNPQSALPFKNGSAVVGCYIPDMNPDAPKEILVGVGKYKELYSRRAAENNTILPIFLKQVPMEYRFVGYYRAIRYSTDRNEIREKNTTDRNNDDIAGVLYFEEVKTL